MDTAVALVQAYLHINAYFTVVEYPVLEASRAGHTRAVTDLDILAFRFAGAGHDVIRGKRHRPMSGQEFRPDPALGCPSDRPDMIVEMPIEPLLRGGRIAIPEPDRRTIVAHAAELAQTVEAVLVDFLATIARSSPAAGLGG